MNCCARKPLRRSEIAREEQTLNREGTQYITSKTRDPFVTFTEWSGEADEKAYADL
jgi:hypothetical protein